MESLRKRPLMQGPALKGSDHPWMTSGKKAVQRSHDIDFNMHAFLGILWIVFQKARVLPSELALESDFLKRVLDFAMFKR